MNDKVPKYPPVAGEWLRQVETEMASPSFLRRLTGIIHKIARDKNMIRGSMLPGGKSCDDLAMDIVVSILSGRRKWKNGKTFFQACSTVARSVVDNWQQKAENQTEWCYVFTASEEWSEIDEKATPYPPDTERIPDREVLQAEIQKRFEDDLLELCCAVEPGTLDERIVEELMVPGGARTRADAIEKLGCTAEEFDAAIKRVKRHAAKIKEKSNA